MSRALRLARPLWASPSRPATFSIAHSRLSSSSSSSSFTRQPSPPRLPPDQQAEFERLQREAEARLYSHAQIEQQQQQSSPAQPEAAVNGSAADGSATFSGGMRQGARPEFDGDVNPRTGEVGGPKNEPLRWGGAGDWSYNGRVTDF